MMIGYREIGLILSIAADRSNDAADHDELHAAAEICKLLMYADMTVGLKGPRDLGLFLAAKEFDVDYIDRWLMGLLRRIEAGRTTRTFCGDVACPSKRNCEDPACSLARGD